MSFEGRVFTKRRLVLSAREGEPRVVHTHTHTHGSTAYQPTRLHHTPHTAALVGVVRVKRTESQPDEQRRGDYTALTLHGNGRKIPTKDKKKKRDTA